MQIPSPTRLAAALVLVYPALILTRNARAALQYGWPGYLVDGLLLVVFLIAVCVSLWRGRRWAYTSALVCSGALAAILVLYEVAVWWVWRAETWDGWSPIDHVLHFLRFAALAAAFVLLVRDTRFAGPRRRALTLFVAALGVELVLMGLIAWLGVGSFFGSRPWYQILLDVSQSPGGTILTQMGMCCGYENETIISDVIRPHWGTITRHGIPALVTANALGLVPLLYLVRSRLIRGSHSRREVPAAAA